MAPLDADRTFEAWKKPFVVSRKGEFIHHAKVVAVIIADQDVHFRDVKLAVRNHEMVTAREVLLATYIRGCCKEACTVISQVLQ